MEGKGEVSFWRLGLLDATGQGSKHSKVERHRQGENTMEGRI